ncbi:MAG: hypothetical protein RL885_05740 [Planctomycetota bacterium]
MSFFVTEPLSRRRNDESGVALIAILSLVVLIGSLSASLLLIGRSHSQDIRLDGRLHRAAEAAETGVVHATFELSRNQDLDGDGGIGTVSGAQGGCTFEVTAEALDRRHVRLVATGRADGASRELEAIVAPEPTTAFRQGLAGALSLHLTGGATTDSYDATLGTYLSQAQNWDDSGRYAIQNGTVSSNGPLSLSGSPTHIRGSAHPGPGETLTGDGFPTVTGSTAALTQPMALEAPQLEQFLAVLATNDNSDIPTGTGIDLDLDAATLDVHSGAVLMLPAGRYLLRRLTIKEDAEIVITGPTTIFLTGDLVIEDAELSNATQEPSQFTLIAHPYLLDGNGGESTDSAEIVVETDGMEVHWKIYAPAVDVDISGHSEIFGAIVGRNVQLSQATVHYDESLAFDSDLEFRPYRRVLWRDRRPRPGIPPKMNDLTRQ